MKLTEIYGETRNQWAVESSEYGAREIDLSRLDDASGEVIDQNFTTWHDVQKRYEGTASIIKSGGTYTVTDDQILIVYTAKDSSGEQYCIFVPSWWS